MEKSVLIFDTTEEKKELLLKSLMDIFNTINDTKPENIAWAINWNVKYEPLSRSPMQEKIKNIKTGTEYNIILSLRHEEKELAGE